MSGVDVWGVANNRLKEGAGESLSARDLPFAARPTRSRVVPPSRRAVLTFNPVLKPHLCLKPRPRRPPECRSRRRAART